MQGGTTRRLMHRTNIHSRILQVSGGDEGIKVLSLVRVPPPKLVRPSERGKVPGPRASGAVWQCSAMELVGATFVSLVSPSSPCKSTDGLPRRCMGNALL